MEKICFCQADALRLGQWEGAWPRAGVAICSWRWGQPSAAESGAIHLQLKVRPSICSWRWSQPSAAEGGASHLQLKVEPAICSWRWGQPSAAEGGASHLQLKVGPAICSWRWGQPSAAESGASHLQLKVGPAICSWRWGQPSATEGGASHLQLKVEPAICNWRWSHRSNLHYEVRFPETLTGLSGTYCNAKGEGGSQIQHQLWPTGCYFRRVSCDSVEQSVSCGLCVYELFWLFSMLGTFFAMFAPPNLISLFRDNKGFLIPESICMWRRYWQFRGPSTRAVLVSSCLFVCMF